MYLKKFIYYFTIDLTVIITLSLKKLAEEFEKQFNGFEQNSFLIEKEVIRIGNSRKEITKTIFYRLSNLVNILAERIYRIKCKYGQDNKKCERHGIKYKICECFLEYRYFK